MRHDARELHPSAPATALSSWNWSNSSQAREAASAYNAQGVAIIRSRWRSFRAAVWRNLGAVAIDAACPSTRHGHGILLGNPRDGIEHRPRRIDEPKGDLSRTLVPSHQLDADRESAGEPIDVQEAV